MYATHFIPDDIYAELKAGTIHHLEFGESPIVIAVAEDGSRHAFDSTVTDEMQRAEHERWRAAVVAAGGWVSDPIAITISFDERTQFRGIVMDAGV